MNGAQASCLRFAGILPALKKTASTISQTVDKISALQVHDHVSIESHCYPDLDYRLAVCPVSGPGKARQFGLDRAGN
jgi:hypothetical protein